MKRIGSAIRTVLGLSVAVVACGSEDSSSSGSAGATNGPDAALDVSAREDSSWDAATAEDGPVQRDAPAVEDSPMDTGQPETLSDVAEEPEVAEPQLPGNRANFVASLMGARYNGAWVRLGMWAFSEDGTLTEDHWDWDQTEAPVPSSTQAQRAKTGYRTVGCPKECDVWTTKGFQPGTSPTKRKGAWSFNSTGQVRVQWPDGQQERYDVLDHGTYVELKLVWHDYPGVSTVYGAVFGSHASLSAAVDMAEIHQVGQLTFELHEQNWDLTTVSKTVTIPMNQYALCTGSPCIQGKSPEVYHTYYAGDPAKDGRKTFWYHQLVSVAGNTNCADIDHGGHTAQLLQVIDDQGVFVGWVGVEASLIGKVYGQSIISHIRMIKP